MRHINRKQLRNDAGKQSSQPGKGTRGNFENCNGLAIDTRGVENRARIGGAEVMERIEQRPQAGQLFRHRGGIDGVETGCDVAAGICRQGAEGFVIGEFVGQDNGDPDSAPRKLSLYPNHGAGASGTQIDDSFGAAEGDCGFKQRGNHDFGAAVFPEDSEPFGEGVAESCGEPGCSCNSKP